MDNHAEFLLYFGNFPKNKRENYVNLIDLLTCYILYKIRNRGGDTPPSIALCLHVQVQPVMQSFDFIPKLQQLISNP